MYKINCVKWDVNLLIDTLKLQSNGPSYSNTVIGTLAADGWAATFGTMRRGLGGAAAYPGPSSLLLLLLLLVCVSFTIIGQPRNSVLIRRV